MACVSLDKECSEFNKLVVENERLKITVFPEPWTGYPNILSEAIKKGRQRILEPDSSLECDVYCLMYSRVRSVSRIVKKSDGFKVIG